MPYKKGDMVRYVEPCSDHRNSPLVLGEVCEVAKTDEFAPHILLCRDGVRLWWVDGDSIVPADQKDYKAQAIIRKIKEIDQRRKELGYAF